MKTYFDAAPRSGRLRAAGVAGLVLAALLAGCGEGGKKDRGASQTAAKVNKEEVTVHQINFLLQQQRGLKPEQADTAGRQVLERLIDQELAVQKAEALKLDRDPRVVQALEAAKREVLTRAYVEKTGDAAPKPSAEEIKKYYDSHPALFKERRLYSIQEMAIEAKPEQIETLRRQLAASKSINQFAESLKAGNVRFAANQAVRAAEQLPMSMLDTFAKMKDGQAILVPAANGAQVIVLAGSRPEPVDEARARPAIEQYLTADARRKLVEADMKAMRAAAKIEYVGKFAEGAASSAPAPAAAPASAPAVSAPAIAAPASAGGLSAAEIQKGMGLK